MPGGALARQPDDVDAVPVPIAVVHLRAGRGAPTPQALGRRQASFAALLAGRAVGPDGRVS